MKTWQTVGLGLAVALAGAGAARGQGMAIPPFEMFLRLDANGDQVIEPSEVPEASRAAFQRLLKLADADKDGKLQAAEFREAIQTMRAGGAGPAGAGAGDAMARFKAIDKDGDGKISRAEFPGRPMMFDRLDANKDGSLDRAELRAFAGMAGAGAPGPSPAAGQPGARIMAMDRDNDGKVSRDEFGGAPMMFDRLDEDHDGVLSKAEAARVPQVMLEALRAMDKDGDKKISRDEFTFPAQRFDQLDADKDGFVTMDEIRNAAPGPAATGKAAAKKGAAKKAEEK